MDLDKSTADRLGLLVAARRYSATGEGRRVREAVGVTVTEVATAADVGVPTVSRYERGLRTPHGERAVRYALVIRALERQIRERP